LHIPEADSSLRVEDLAAKNGVASYLLGFSLWADERVSEVLLGQS